MKVTINHGLLPTEYVKLRTSLRNQGVRPRFIRPVFISELRSFVFYPRQIDITGRMVKKVQIGRSESHLAPAFQSLEEFAQYAEKDLFPGAGNLVRAGVLLLMEGKAPSQLPQVQLAEILAVKNNLPKDKELVYLQQEGLYVLTQPLHGRMAVGKSSLMPFPEKNGGYLTAFNRAQDLLDFLNPQSEQPRVDPDVTQRFLVLGDERMRAIRSEPLPKTSVVAGQHTNLVSGITACGFSDPGKERTNNEDAFVIAEDLGLYMVADGMGGHGAGEVASEIAVRIIHGAHKHGLSLLEAISLAQAEIVRAAQENPIQRDMGTTVVVAKVEGDLASFAWVGDSRIYLNGALLSQDHSFSVEALELLLGTEPRKEESSTLAKLREKSSGKLTWPLEGEILTLFERVLAEEPFLSRKNIVSRALSQQGGNPSTLDHIPLRDGDWILLCSDGLTDELLERTPQIIETCRAKKMTIQETARELRRAALEGTAKDNITIVLYEHRSDPKKTRLMPLALVELQAEDPRKLIKVLNEIISGTKPVPQSSIPDVISRLNAIMNASRESNPEVYAKALKAMTALAAKL